MLFQPDNAGFHNDSFSRDRAHGALAGDAEDYSSHFLRTTSAPTQERVWEDACADRSFDIDSFLDGVDRGSRHF